MRFLLVLTELNITSKALKVTIFDSKMSSSSSSSDFISYSSDSDSEYSAPKIVAIYCINLEDAKDRWSRMEARIQKFSNKLPSEIVHWNATPAAEVSSYGIKLEPQDVPHPFGALGCAYSHLMVWWDALNYVDNSNDCVLILEDDMKFHKNWESLLLSGLDKISKQDTQWHALFLHFGNQLEIKNTWTLISDQSSTGAYVLSKSGLKTLTRMFDFDDLWTSDAMTQSLQAENHCYGYFPWLAVQENLDSQIHDSAHFEEDRKRINDAIKGIENDYS